MTVLSREQFKQELMKGIEESLVPELAVNPDFLTSEIVAELTADLVKSWKIQYQSQQINNRIGKVKDIQAVCEYLGNAGKPLSQQAVNDRVRKHNLLRLKSKSGRNGYPVFQFSDGGVHSGVRQLMHVLFEGDFSEWGIAYWLTEPMDFIDGRRPIDVLDDEEAFALVLRRAKTDVNDRKA